MISTSIPAAPAVALALVVGCAQAGRAPAAPARSPVKVVGADAGQRLRDADGRLRPEATAGVYWIPYVTCDDCAPPAALVAYVTDDVAKAREVVAALDGRLPLGLPYVVHTEQLVAGPPRIAVVIGAFATGADAAASSEGSAPIAGVAPLVLAVDTGYWVDAPHHVTTIDRGGPVAAWSQADVQAVDEAMSESPDPDAHQTMESQRAWFLRELGKRAPACTVSPGDLFVVEDAQLDWYRLAPVQCAGALAYVPWTSTLLGHAVIVPDERGGHRLRQVVGAECDSPIIEEWRYDQRGRHPLEPEAGAGDQLALGGC